MHPSPQPLHRRQGQAIVEFVVGLIAILAVVAGMLQIVSLSRARTDTLTEARRQAGELAMLDAAALDNAPYLESVDAGGDERTFTADDEDVDGNPGQFYTRIVDRSTATPGEWAVIESAPEDLYGQLYPGGGNPNLTFGMVRGESDETVPVLSAVQKLLYRADEIDVEAEVWMTRTGDIY